MSQQFDKRNLIRKDARTICITFSFDSFGPDARDTWKEVTGEWKWTTHLILKSEIPETGIVIRPARRMKVGFFEIVCCDEQEADLRSAELLEHLGNYSSDLDEIRLGMQDYLSGSTVDENGKTVPTPQVKCFLQGPPDAEVHDFN
jgi:hypothetical protein